MVEYKAEFVMLKQEHGKGQRRAALRHRRGSILTMLNPTATPSDAVYLERGCCDAVFGLAGRRAQEQSSAPYGHRAVARARTAAASPALPCRAGALRSPAMTLPGGVFAGTMIPYEPASLDNTQPSYSLTRRANETDARVPVPTSDWKFATCDTGTNAFPGTPASRVCLKGGFDPAYLYELVYVAKDPKVMGVEPGRAARHREGFFRNKAADSNSTPNPLWLAVSHAGAGHLAVGQRDEGLPAPGLQPGAGWRQGVRRHVRPRRGAPDQHQHPLCRAGGGGGLRTDHTAFGRTAPRGLDKDYMDDIGERQGGVMKRCAATNTCPKFFLGGHRVLAAAGLARADRRHRHQGLVQPDNARIYYYASTQHGGAGARPALPTRPRVPHTPRARWCASTTPSAPCSSTWRTGWCAARSHPPAGCPSWPTARWCGGR